MPANGKIPPFGRNDKASLGKVHQLFGDKLNTIIEELNETLAA
jgi:type I restriction enzyme R subunit